MGWAEDFVLSDHRFASVPGPSFSNHLFFIAGQAGGTMDTPVNIETKPLNDGRKFKSWGCDAYGDDVYVHVASTTTWCRRRSMGLGSGSESAHRDRAASSGG